MPKVARATARRARLHATEHPTAAPSATDSLTQRYKRLVEPLILELFDLHLTIYKRRATPAKRSDYVIALSEEIGRLRKVFTKLGVDTEGL